MRPSTPWFATGAFALAFMSCPPKGTSVNTLPVAGAGVLATWAAPGSADTVRVLNGGYGSAIARDPRHEDRFYLLTDRGPNYATAKEENVAFPKPDFSPQIGLFVHQGDSLVRQAVITLKDTQCRPLTGLPLPAGRPGATGEVGYAVDGTPLPADTNGVDTEGLVANADGSFWVSDEYGPYIFKVNAEGCTTVRLSAGAGLPRVALKRRVNRGFEGLTSPDGGKTVVAMFQAPLDNPKAAGRASRLARILVVEPTGRTRQYGYLLEDKGLGVSDILWMGGSRYLVLERDGKWIGDSTAVKRFYAIDLKDATDLSDPADGATGRLVDGKTLEELTAGAADPAAALAAAGLHPVSKVLALDIAAAAPGYHHDKLEGATRVNGHTIAVINDDDFGVTEADGGMAVKHAPGSSTPDRNELLLLRVPLP